jgi:anti-sigma B factor antagonist
VTKPATYRVARCKDGVYVRVAGLGNMNNSTTFKEFLDRMQREGFKAIVVDLGECRGVDSTFMGVLLGFREHLVVVNAGPHCRKQMESIGLHRVLQIQEQAAVPPAVELCDLPETEADPTTRLRLIMKAHQDLIAIDRENEKKFGAFLKDIAKHLGPH